MKLPNPFGKQQQEGSYYLALLLGDDKATAVVLRETLGKIHILGKHTENFSESIETLPIEALTDVLDKTISRAEEILPPQVETHQTVFGVKNNWVDEETKKIKPKYLDRLKKVCHELDLTPIGFMVLIEAITNLLQEEDGAPVSALLAEIGKTAITITLLKGGNMVETLSSPHEEGSPVTTVDKLLHHITAPVLPTRIILLNSEISEHLTQQFISHHWTKNLPFLHVPEITVLPEGFAGRAITYGAAKQMGFTVVDPEQEKVQTVSSKEHEDDVKETPVILEKEDETEIDKEALEEVIAEEAVPKETVSATEDTTPEDFGFVVNKDIEKEPEASVKTKDIDAPAPHTKTESLHSSHPHPEEKTHEPKITHHTHLGAQTSDNLVLAHDEEPEESKRSGRKEKASPFAFLARLNSLKPNISLGTLTKNKLAVKIGIIVIVLAALIGGLTYYYLYQTKATVKLTVKPEMADETSNVTFSTTASSDFSRDVIEAKSIEVSIDGSLSRNATGKKDIGEKAKGTVTLYNNGQDSAEISKGTQLKASNDLIFITDKDVDIASASGDIFSGTKPGTVDVPVIAKEIGSDYNLPSGTKFSIGGDIAAKNDGAFSGGSKKSVTVVSKDDIAKLQVDLPKSLEAKARTAIAKKASGDETVLPSLITVETEKAVFDRDVDEEAKTVKMTAIVTFAGVAYENEALLEYAKSLVKNNADQDVQFADDTITADIANPKQKSSSQITAKVLIQAGLLPDIDKQDVIRSIQDKSVGDATQTLESLPQIEASEITFSPAIPLLPNLFPRLPNQISVSIESGN